MKSYGWLILVLMLLPSTGIASQTILVFGDSLSASYGIPREAGWVSLLEKRLAKERPEWRVVNASISGETTSGGLQRIDTALAMNKPTVIIIALGANDGLRGLGIGLIRQNLSAMIEVCRKAKVQVLLIGMKIPPNYGLQYTQDFSENYKILAKQYKAALVPFLLDGVAGNPELIQPDGLHPIAAAQPRIMQNVWPALEKLIIRSHKG